MTFDVILNQMNNLCIHNLSIRSNFYQNRFINEGARKIFKKFLEGRKTGVFFMRYRRNSVLIVYACIFPNLN